MRKILYILTDFQVTEAVASICFVVQAESLECQVDPINDLIFCDRVAVQVAEEGAVLPTPNCKKG